jgi:hypothetical protein
VGNRRYLPLEDPQKDVLEYKTDGIEMNFLLGRKLSKAAITFPHSKLNTSHS